MQNNNIGISKFLKTNGLFLIIGIAVMIATVTAISAILGKIPRYEIFYPITEVIICCIPAFVSTRSTIKRLNCLFLPTVVFQTTCIIIILLFVSAALNGSFESSKKILPLFLPIFLSSFLAVLIPFRNRKKRLKIK